jgi:hypothetical protein
VTARWRSLPLDEVSGHRGEGHAVWHRVRPALGIEAFGVNAWSATAPGQQLIAEHDELAREEGGHEELYVVLSGHAVFTVDGETVQAPAGTLLFVKDPAVKRSGIARDEGTTVIVAGAPRGRPYAPSEWGDRSAEALRYWATGDWERAVDVLRLLHAERPDNATALYNLACAEARAGLAEASVEHLLAAVVLDPGLVGYARDDPDLEPVRDHPGFPRS